MKFNSRLYVDDDQNIVEVITKTMTPAEFLQSNSEVFAYAEMMKPGARIEKAKAQIHKELSHEQWQHHKQITKGEL